MVIFMYKAFKFRLYPNKKQAQFFNKTFGCCRFVYNQMLNDRIESYKNTGKTSARTPAALKKEYPWLKEVDSLALSNEGNNLNTAYKAFFNKQNSFPKFKTKKNDKDSYTTFNLDNTIRLNKGMIRLPKIGQINCKTHRAIPEDWKLKSATISKTPTNKYFVSVLFEYEQQIEPIKLNINNSLGIDYASNGFGITSDGEVLSSHRYFRENQAKLAKEQKKLSRKKKGSKNYEKQRIKVALVHEHIVNCRKDQAHQLSARLAKQYDVICLEDINLQNIAQSLKLGKSTNDNGFGMFREFLQYKMKDLGKQVIYIDKWQPTSTVCSACGAYHKDIVNSLAIREWTCPDCGTHHNRDTNAAENILKAGIATL